MFWIQTGLAFVIWIAAGLSVRRVALLSPHELRKRPRKQRLSALILLFPVAILILGGGIACIAAFNGLAPTGLAPWAWLLLALSGSTFVWLQTAAMSVAVSLAMDARQTGDAIQSSNQNENLK